MTLDDFLRTLESLIDDREANDDPGEGNFGCEDCRKCNHCRFCVGCDSCTDCTYCEESIDCTSCTQSKRCVSCEKVSYCEDCRDCKGSRYLTLCVECSDCVHCLACVGLEGAEFYVLNEKRTRKEYFALLRQVQELMQARMEVGWRPPGMGLASDVDDPVVAGRDMELTAAPWLDDGPSTSRRDEPVREDYRDRDEPIRDPYAREPIRARDPYARDDELPRERPGARGAGFERRREPEPVRDPDPIRAREPEPVRARELDPVSARPRRDPYADDYPEPELEPPRRAREPRRSERDELLDDPRRAARGSVAPAGRYDEPGYREPEPAEPRRRRASEREVWDEREAWDPPAAARTRDREFDTDVPRTHEQQPTQPFTGRRAPRVRDPEPEPEWDDEWDDRPDPRVVAWEDSHERTVARAPIRSAERPSSYDLREPAAPNEPARDDIPRAHDREPSSPWLDEEAQARRRAKRGSLRRAGRPKRKPDGDSPSDASGSGTGSGSGSGRAAPEGTHTTGLRLGRKPKRR